MTSFITRNRNELPFVSVENMMKIVLDIGVENVLSGLVDYIEEDFRRWEKFHKTPRVASHSEEGVIELMPTSDGELYGFKYVNGHPKNMAEGLQTVTAFGLLADVASGYPVMMSEMTILTALRTAATSVMAAKYLAPQGADCMALIGNGAQAEFQALGFHSVLGVSTLRLYDSDYAATEKCVRNLEGTGFELIVCTSAREAITGAQIITTSTADKQHATIVTNDMIEGGVHINGVGGDCPGKTELDADLLHRADIFVEFPEQTRIEGDIQQMPDDHPVIEIWRVVSGREPGRTSAEQITVFDSVGFSVEDFSALRYIHDQLLQKDCYEHLDMIANPEDPRDLYGMVMRSGGR